MKIESKMRVALLLSRLVTSVGSTTRTVTRGGVKWELDLKDAIDLSIYLFGGFQARTFSTLRELTGKDGIVIDVGCNRGALTIPLAKAADRGRIIALDPVGEHCDCLRRGLAHNPEISCEVVVEQAFVSSSIASKLPSEVGAKWDVDKFRKFGDEICAIPCSTGGAMITSIDDIVRRHGISQLSAVKIDVDGYELDVINGGKETFRDLGAPIVMEWAPTAMRMRGVVPYELASRIQEFGYQPEMISSRGTRKTTWDHLVNIQMGRTSIDLLLTK